MPQKVEGSPYVTLLISRIYTCNLPLCTAREQLLGGDGTSAGEFTSLLPVILFMFVLVLIRYILLFRAPCAHSLLMHNKRGLFVYLVCTT